MKPYTIGLYEKAMPDLSWEEKLLATKEAGYDFLEISIDASEEKISRVYWSRDERKKLVDLMYETGVPIQTLNGSALTKYAIGDPNPEISERGMEILYHAISLAADLGVRILMIPGYDIYYGESTPETQQRFIRNLEKATLAAASAGVQIGMETMENRFMNTCWKGMYYVKMIGSNYLGLYPDCGNMKNACFEQGCDEAQDLMSAKGHVFALHLKETRPGVYREVPYGEGKVDFPKIIDAAWKIGVRRYVTEFWYTGSPEWQKDLADTCRRMRGILGLHKTADAVKSFFQ
ncbi:MAG: L-ribulose-5-phosphate 3-epimerase [Eubacterium sp.]|nr:L-ribulose-5-phosphate 3-epimerase [Eubacterium sp.]